MKGSAEGEGSPGKTWVLNSMASSGARFFVYRDAEGKLRILPTTPLGVTGAVVTWLVFSGGQS